MSRNYYVYGWVERHSQKVWNQCSTGFPSLMPLGCLYLPIERDKSINHRQCKQMEGNLSSRLGYDGPLICSIVLGWQSFQQGGVRNAEENMKNNRGLLLLTSKFVSALLILMNVLHINGAFVDGDLDGWRHHRSWVERLEGKIITLHKSVKRGEISWQGVLLMVLG